MHRGKGVRTWADTFLSPQTVRCAWILMAHGPQAQCGAKDIAESNAASIKQAAVLCEVQCRLLVKDNINGSW